MEKRGVLFVWHGQIKLHTDLSSAIVGVEKQLRSRVIAWKKLFAHRHLVSSLTLCLCYRASNHYASRSECLSEGVCPVGAILRFDESDDRVGQLVAKPSHGGLNFNLVLVKIFMTNIDSDPEAQPPETISPVPSTPYAQLITAKNGAGGSGIHEIYTCKSETEDVPALALPISTDREIDLEAQPGTSPIQSKPFHYCPSPIYRWSSYCLTFLRTKGRRNESRDVGIHQSACDAHENHLINAPAPARSRVEMQAHTQGEADHDPGA